MEKHNGLGYIKFVLTIIAVCLVWMSFKPLIVSDAVAVSGQPVNIVAVDGRSVRHSPLAVRVVD